MTGRKIGSSLFDGDCLIVYYYEVLIPIFGYIYSILNHLISPQYRAERPQELSLYKISETATRHANTLNNRPLIVLPKYHGKTHNCSAKFLFSKCMIGMGDPLR